MASSVSLCLTVLALFALSEAVRDNQIFNAGALESSVGGSASKTHTSSRLVEEPLNLQPTGGPSLGEDAPEIGHYAGYFKLNRTHDARMFYFFFESRGNKSSDPVVLWMTGGPGCSSEVAVFFENGPFHISDDLQLSWNKYGWDQVSSMIFVDQPINTGFSYSHDPRDMRHDEKGVSQDVYEFLQEFFEAHPEYADRDFFVTGESYAGHYVPAVSRRIHNGNKKGEGRQINLKGFAIGNGLTEPDIQYGYYAEFAHQNHLISDSSYKGLKLKYPVCRLAIKACGTKGTFACVSAMVICNSIIEKILLEAGDINVYDVRQKCEHPPLCYDFSVLEMYLNQEETRKALGVGDRKWVACSPSVHMAMMVDWMRNLEVGIPEMLEDGVKMLVYAGEWDFICNWLGNAAWVSEMPWSGQDGYNACPWANFTVGGKEAGQTKANGALSFLKVKDAGHMVPMDQPEASLEMLRRWTRGLPLGESSKGIAMAGHSGAVATS